MLQMSLELLGFGAHLTLGAFLGFISPSWLITKQFLQQGLGFFHSARPLVLSSKKYLGCVVSNVSPIFSVCTFDSFIIILGTCLWDWQLQTCPACFCVWGNILCQVWRGRRKMKRTHSMMSGIEWGWGGRGGGVMAKISPPFVWFCYESKLPLRYVKDQTQARHGVHCFNPNTQGWEAEAGAFVSLRPSLST